MTTTGPVRQVAPAAPPAYPWLRAAAVLVGSWVAGALTVLGAQVLPESLHRVANSSGSWTLVAFALVWWSRARPLPAALLGAASFLLLNVGYAQTAGALIGYDYPLSLTNFWVAAGFVAGPLVGVGASWLRLRRDVLAALGVAGLAGVLVGDGYGGLTLYPSESPVYWVLSIVVGVVVLVAATGLRLVGATPRTVAVVATLVVAVLYHLGNVAQVNGLL